MKFLPLNQFELTGLDLLWLHLNSLSARVHILNSQIKFTSQKIEEINDISSHDNYLKLMVTYFLSAIKCTKLKVGWHDSSKEAIERKIISIESSPFHISFCISHLRPLSKLRIDRQAWCFLLLAARSTLALNHIYRLWEGGNLWIILHVALWSVWHVASQKPVFSSILSSSHLIIMPFRWIQF